MNHDIGGPEMRSVRSHLKSRLIMMYIWSACCLELSSTHLIKSASSWNIFSGILPADKYNVVE